MYKHFIYLLYICTLRIAILEANKRLTTSLDYCYTHFKTKQSRFTSDDILKQEHLDGLEK